MTWDPRNFFVGLADFFTILLPGGILVFALSHLFADRLPAGGLLESEVGLWLAVFGMSYVAGHFLFMFGALLDFIVFDPLVNLTLSRQIIRFAEGKIDRPNLLAAHTLGRLVNPQHSTREAALGCATALRDAQLARLGGGATMNVYKWAKLWLQERGCDQHLSEIHRFENDSKFFRSFVVLLPLLLASWLAAWALGQPAAARPPSPTAWLVAFGLFAGALFRYCEQRDKAVMHACRAAIVHAATLDPPPTAGSRNLRAGGVVFRRADAGYEILLVSPKSDLLVTEDALSKGPPRRLAWVLPKGKVEPGELPVTAAVREVLEEGGVWARPRAFLGMFAITETADGEAECAYFLLESVGKQRKPEPGRSTTWCPIDRPPDGVPKDILEPIAKAGEAIAQLGPTPDG